MVRHIFSPEEYQSFSLEQLRRLAAYYQVAWDKKTSKKALIQAIDQKAVYVVPDSEAVWGENGTEGAPMSVRVRRIMEQNKVG